MFAFLTDGHIRFLPINDIFCPYPEQDVTRYPIDVLLDNAVVSPSDSYLDWVHDFVNTTLHDNKYFTRREGTTK